MIGKKECNHEMICCHRIGQLWIPCSEALYENRSEVLAIDAEKNRVQAIDANFTEAIVIDATDKDDLKALGFENLDEVIRIYGNQNQH